jgi:hypothetical protein
MIWIALIVALVFAAAIAMSENSGEKRKKEQEAERQADKPRPEGKYVTTTPDDLSDSERSGVMRVRLRESSENISNPSRIIVIDEEKPDADAIALSGGVRRRIYVYDDVPLNGMESNHAFYLDLMGRDISLRSVTTGGMWNSARQGDVPLSYHGRPVGFLNVKSYPKLKKAARLRRIQIRAVWPGGIVSNVMRVVALMPSTKAVENVIEKILGEERK